MYASYPKLKHSEGKAFLIKLNNQLQEESIGLTLLCSDLPSLEIGQMH